MNHPFPSMESLQSWVPPEAPTTSRRIIPMNEGRIRRHGGCCFTPTLSVPTNAKHSPLPARSVAWEGEGPGVRQDKDTKILYTI